MNASPAADAHAFNSVFEPRDALPRAELETSNDAALKGIASIEVSVIAHGDSGAAVGDCATADHQLFDSDAAATAHRTRLPCRCGHLRWQVWGAFPRSRSAAPSRLHVRLANTKLESTRERGTDGKSDEQRRRDKRPST